jgi:hypothetical protein
VIRPFEDSRVTGVQGRYVTEQRSLVARFAQLEIEQRYEIMESHPTIDMVGTYSAAFRTEVFRKFGGFDANFPTASGEDMDFSFRLQEAGHRLVFAPKAIVAHQHPTTARAYFKQKFGRAYWRYLLYLKHPKKIIRDTYTPQGLKLQVAMLGVFVLALLAAPFWSAGPYVIAASLGLFHLVLLPFEVRLCRKDPVVGLVAPWLLLGRAASLLSGLAVAGVGLGRIRAASAVSARAPVTATPALDRRPATAATFHSSLAMAPLGATAVSAPGLSNILVEPAKLGQYIAGSVLTRDPLPIELTHPGG